ncbi:MAG: hypothetical protein HOO06_11545 [Bdellovibrionaceae bacterium]|jgi:hypothetical protein|nr:hypothetical protein [Pseudobdellovibrionaceae bacterium]
MPKDTMSPIRKALQINLDDQVYGSFAEIGAGQEVARHFFQAGRASHTVAKSMSAYDMKFSDEIYGREDSGRYVVESRLLKMLEKEFLLLKERLLEKRGDETCFFSFASTVTTSSNTKGARCHGWIGVCYQLRPGGPTNKIILHLNMKDKFRLQQQEALGVLGVNLIHAAFYRYEKKVDLINSLTDNLSPDRVEIDMIRSEGVDLKHIDNRLLSLELVRQGFTDAVLFAPNGKVVQAAEALHGQAVLLQRGTFRPVTKTNMLLIDHSLEEIKNDNLEKKPMAILELTMHLLNTSTDPSATVTIDQKDFLDRVETLTLLGHHVLISNFFYFYQLKEYLRRCTKEEVYMTIGAPLLDKLFNNEYYKKLPHGILGAFGNLFDSKTKLLVFPYKDNDICLTSQAFSPEPSLYHLYKHLFENKFIKDISNCDNIDTTVHSSNIRQMLEENDPNWEDLVPDIARDHIKKKKLFGLGEK